MLNKTQLRKKIRVDNQIAMSKDKEVQLEYVPQRTSGDVEAHLLYSRHGVSSISKQTYDAVSDLLKAKSELLEGLKRFYNHSQGKVDDFQDILYRTEELITKYS